MVKTNWLTFSDDLEPVYQIRKTVFVMEQKIPEHIEMDNKDSCSAHLLVSDDNRPVATGRLSICQDEAIIGRIAVLKEYRGQHYGDLVVRLLTRKAYESGCHRQIIHAQRCARIFYEKIGYHIVGEPYSEAGIPHITMVHEGDIVGSCIKN